MIQAFGHGQLHAGLENAPRLAGQSLRGLAQQLEARVGQQGMLGTGMAEGVLDEWAEALALGDGHQIQTYLDAARERRVGGTREGLGQTRMAEQPDGHEIARIEGEVEERRQIAEELHGQIVRFIDDPQQRDAFAVGQIQDAGLDLAYFRDRPQILVLNSGSCSYYSRIVLRNSG